MICMYMLIMQKDRYICNIWITIKENIHFFLCKTWITKNKRYLHVISAKSELQWIQEYILYMQNLNYMYDDERYGHVKYAKL